MSASGGSAGAALEAALEALEEPESAGVRPAPSADPGQPAPSPDPVQPERSPEGEVEGAEAQRIRALLSDSADHGDAGSADPSTPLRYAQGERGALEPQPQPEPEAPPDPVDWLINRAPSMGFFALGALLDRLTDTDAPIGGGGPFEDEPVMLRHDPALAFSGGDVAKLSRAKGDVSRRPKLDLTTTFLGLTGAVGPLPTFYAEEVAQEEGEYARRDFLDIFHHRLLSMLFRGVGKYDLSFGARSEADDPWARRILALAGVDASVAAPDVPAPVLLRLAPLFATCRRPPEALEQVVAEVFGEELGGATVEVIPFTGEWTEIEPSERMRLGRTHHQLGSSSVLGQRVFDRGGKFTVRLAPLSQAVYPRLLPDGDLHPRIASLVGFFAGTSLDFDLELVLEASPGLRLSRASTTRLGRDTWLRSRAGEVGKTLRVRGSAPNSPSSST